MDSTKASEKLDAFFATGKETHYSKRAVILGYGEKNDSTYWITKGYVTVVSCNKDGLERIQHIYKAQELFPVKTIFDNEQFDVAFFAFTDVTVRVQPHDEFIRFIEKQPDAMLAIIHQQSAVLDGLVNLNYETAEQRIAFKLISLSRRMGTRSASLALATCPVTVQELASTVRVSSATTGKILNKFEKAGMVALRRQNILVDAGKLKKVLED